ncbi:MAG: type II/IV secretion system ATPase subunit [Candidatus Brockarchaeota archaeon]|nr:type II/IV secretion system ATPase subunit [Candidatus Brockarchaeota archaeon]
MSTAKAEENKKAASTIVEAKVEAKPAPPLPPPKKEEKKKKKEEEEVLEYVFDPVPPNTTPVDTYWIEEPYVRIVIAPIPGKGGQKGYFIDEVTLNKNEKNAFNRIKEILSRELAPPKDMSVDARQHVVEEAKRLMKKYKGVLGSLNEESIKKVEYYIRRDLIGYGPINPIIEDKNIEDISCDGINKPIYVWHKKHESLPSNLRIMDKNYFNDFIIKLAHFAGKHISAAFPIVDAMLPGKHRLAATYGDEVSTFGSTFTIRKFREEPFSIVDLINMGTINPALAAYFWFTLDNRLTIIIIGGTGAGKTSFLNALTNLFKPGLKIVTVEETAELNIPHDNWVQFVTRESYGLGTSKIGEITMFDLVKTSLRYRPDYLIVGEIRGAEAFVMFQAMATGHGGLSTVHAENIEYAIKRMTSPPMNIAESYIPLMNVACLVERVVLPKKAGVPFGRRVRQVWELDPEGNRINIASWNPVEDSFEIDFSRSVHLPNICRKSGMPPDWYVRELQVRESVIRWMMANNITHFRDVARVVTEFHVKRSEVISKLR